MVYIILILVGIFYIFISHKLELSAFNFIEGWLVLILILLSYGSIVEDHFYETEYRLPNPFEYAHITELDFKATLHDSASEGNYLEVKEIVNFDVHSFNKDNLCVELWRGMDEYKADGMTTTYEIKSVKQILPNGERINYSESPQIYKKDSDYTDSNLGPYKWYHLEGRYNSYNGMYQLLMMYPEPTYRDNLKYEIEYEVRGCTYKYVDCSEIYFQVFNTDATKYIKKFDFEFLIPYNLMPKRNNYYFKFNGTDDIVVKHTVDNEINPGYYTFSVHKEGSDLKFGLYNRFLEFLIVTYNDDKHIISEYANNESNIYTNTYALEEIRNEQYEYEMNIAFKYIKITIFVLCIVGSFGVLIYTKYTLSKGVKGEGAMTKPKYDYDYYATVPEKIDYHIASGIFNCKNIFNSNPIELSFPAILLSLANKGFIKIEDDTLTRLQDYTISRENEFLINTLNDGTNRRLEDVLTPSEIKVFNLIKRQTGGNPTINMKNLFNRIRLDYYNTSSFYDEMNKLIQDYGYNHGLFSKSNYNESREKIIEKGKYMLRRGLMFLVVVNFISFFTRFGFAFGGYTILGLTFILCALYLFKRSNDFVLLTEKGEIEYQKWHAYYNYLKNETLYHETDREDLNNYDECLLYAIALGLPEKKIKKLKTKFPNVFKVQDDLNNSTYIGGHYHHFRHYGHTMHRSTAVARSTFSASRSIGSSYSRGGRGGGGGF